MVNWGKPKDILQVDNNFTLKHVKVKQNYNRKKCGLLKGSQLKILSEERYLEVICIRFKKVSNWIENR